MATLWDMLMGSGSLTGGTPQQQPTGLLGSLAGSTGALMGSGFMPGPATPQAPQPGLPAFASGQVPALNIGQKPQGFDAIRPASADMPATSAAPAMGQGVPGGISVPGYDGTFTRDQADDGDGRPSLKEWDAANATKGVSGTIASGLAAGKGLAAASGLPTDIRPQAQGGPGLPVAPSSSDGGPLGFLSGFGDRFKNIYGNGGAFDPLIALGIGMNSGPGGMQRALETISTQGQQRQNNALQTLNMQIAQAKLLREQQTQQGSAAYIKAAYKAQGQDISDDQAAALAQNSGALSTIVSGTFKDKAATPQLVDVPQPDGSTQKQWITPGAAAGTAVGSSATKTPDAVRDLQFARQNWQANGLPDPNDPKNAAFWQDFAQKRLAGGAPSMSVSLPPAEKASDMAYGQAEGKHFGDILSAGDTARQTQSQLAFMNDAFNQGGGSISTGPFAKSILAAKQAILNTTGVDLGGVPESEAVNKLGFGLATNLTKEISQRPAQQEFIKALQNVPGLLLSPQGSRVMTSIINQQSQSKIDLGDLVQDPDNRKNWGQTVKNYYATHPYVSPFTGKPLNVGDLNDLRASARQAGIDPATGQAGGSGGGTAGITAPSWSFTPGN